jgi:CopG family nickel-responsive transcriptional regulator
MLTIFERSLDIKELKTRENSKYSYLQEKNSDNLMQSEKAKVTRFSVSLEPQLLRDFDEMIARIGYSRSTAIITAMRNFIVDRLWESEAGEVVGAITLIYNHHRSGITEELTDIQHDYHHEITTTTHVHLDHDNCLEIVAVRGKTQRIKELSEKLTANRWVKQSRISILKI